ncbi:unnamed protein product, partial [Didymodactylos carnosus]
YDGKYKIYETFNILIYPENSILLNVRVSLPIYVKHHKRVIINESVLQVNNNDTIAFEIYRLPHYGQLEKLNNNNISWTKIMTKFYSRDIKANRISYRHTNDSSAIDMIMLKLTNNIKKQYYINSSKSSTIVVSFKTYHYQLLTRLQSRICVEKMKLKKTSEILEVHCYV